MNKSDLQFHLPLELGAVAWTEVLGQVRAPEGTIERKAPALGGGISAPGSLEATRVRSRTELRAVPEAPPARRLSGDFPKTFFAKHSISKAPGIVSRR